MCSETSPPRLSFSSDLGQTDVVMPLEDHMRRDTSLLDLNCEFEFSISTCSEQESSSADELFSHGIILPIQPRERQNVNVPDSKEGTRSEIPSLFSLPPLPINPENSKKEKHKVITALGSDHSDQQIKPQSKSFWGTFKRSSSLNSENKRSLLCSIPLLSRSNSTGSVANNKRNAFRDVNKNSTSTSQRQPLISMTRSSSSSSSSSSKPPLKKNYGGSHGNGVRIIPVLNVPPPYIPKGTAKLFGLGSFSQHSKDRKSKK